MTFEELFRDPTAQYRGAPFWSWNDKLDKTVLAEQLPVFRQMGFGGFHIHSRIGLATEYLGEEFMDCVKACDEQAQKLGLMTWLYDEDSYPSGFAGGRVTIKEEYRQRCLLLSDKPIEARLLGKFAVELKNGALVSYHPAAQEEEGVYFYEKIIDAEPWYNDGCYGDVLNYDAVKEFIAQTHEVYYAHMGDRFGKTVPAIFTDEPQFCRQQPLEDGQYPTYAKLAYTIGIEDAFREKYGYDLPDRLPELFWQWADGSPGQVRYHYFDLLSERYSDSYCGQIDRWCQDHGIHFTGHVAQETSLEDQTEFCGDCMRAYRNFGLPGIDVLCGDYEYTGLKQAQSVSRQEQKPGVLSELYGVTNWDHDFRGHKLQGDWQAALGVTTRVPHLAWLSMRGEAKRDYPAPIDFHSPWYEKYHLIEDHFARVNTAMTRGKPVVKVAVVHPIESFWMLYGPNAQTKQARKSIDERFAALTQWLLFGQIDLDYLCEGLLPKQQVAVKDGRLHVGAMAYDAVVLPELLTIRKTTLDILRAFSKAGGTVIVTGKLPVCVDAVPTAVELPHATKTCFEKEALLSALQSWRDVEIFLHDGTRAPYLFYQLRRDEQDLRLFIAHGRELTPREAAMAQENPIKIFVKGRFNAELCDTMTGTISGVRTHVSEDMTSLTLPLNAHDSLLLRLTQNDVSCAAKQQLQPIEQKYLNTVHAYRTEEPNVLLLDQAQWRLDDGPWQAKEEILKIDDAARDLLGLRRRDLAMPQPWLWAHIPPQSSHTLELRFAIHSKCEIDSVDLAFEDAPQIIWNGELVCADTDRWYVDRSLHRVRLGAVKQGENILTLRYAFHRDTQPEWCYLLGDFGVQVSGTEAILTKKPTAVAFGSYHNQGFAFYGGNFTYVLKTETQSGLLELEVPHYRAAVLGVRLDGGEEQLLFAAPYRIQLGQVESGTHTIEVCSYGTRINQFGQVHHCNDAEFWMGPHTWRTEGSHWCYEYRLKDVGILTAPILRIYQAR